MPVFRYETNRGIFEIDSNRELSPEELEQAISADTTGVSTPVEPPALPEVPFEAPTPEQQATSGAIAGGIEESALPTRVQTLEQRRSAEFPGARKLSKGEQQELFSGDITIEEVGSILAGQSPIEALKPRRMAEDAVLASQTEVGRVVETAIGSLDEQARGLAQLILKGAETAGFGGGRVDPLIEKLNEPILKLPVKLAKQRADRAFKLIKEGRIEELLIDQSKNFALDLGFKLSEMQLLFGVALPGQAATGVGTSQKRLNLAKNALKRGLFSGATTPGDVIDRLKTTFWTTAYMLTPIVAQEVPSNPLAAIADFALNLGIDTARGDIQKAIKDGVDEAFESGQGGRYLQFAVKNLIPIVGASFAGSLMTQSARSGGDMTKVLTDAQLAKQQFNPVSEAVARIDETRPLVSEAVEEGQGFIQRGEQPTTSQPPGGQEKFIPDTPTLIKATKGQGDMAPVSYLQFGPSKRPINTEEVEQFIKKTIPGAEVGVTRIISEIQPSRQKFRVQFFEKDGLRHANPPENFEEIFTTPQVPEQKLLPAPATQRLEETMKEPLSIEEVAPQEIQVEQAGIQRPEPLVLPPDEPFIRTPINRTMGALRQAIHKFQKDNEIETKEFDKARSIIARGGGDKGIKVRRFSRGIKPSESLSGGTFYSLDRGRDTGYGKLGQQPELSTIYPKKPLEVDMKDSPSAPVAAIKHIKGEDYFYKIEFFEDAETREALLSAGMPESKVDEVLNLFPHKGGERESIRRDTLGIALAQQKGFDSIIGSTFRGIEEITTINDVFNKGGAISGKGLLRNMQPDELLRVAERLGMTQADLDDGVRLATQNDRRALKVEALVDKLGGTKPDPVLTGRAQRSTVRRLDALTSKPMQIFEKFDGERRTGPHRKLIFDPVIEGFNRHLTKVDDFKRQYEKVILDSGLGFKRPHKVFRNREVLQPTAELTDKTVRVGNADLSVPNLIHMYYASQNDQLRNATKFGNNVSDATIAEAARIVEGNPQYKNLADNLQRLVAGQYEELRRVFKTVRGVDLPQVKNYWRIARTEELLNSKEIDDIDKLMQALEEQGGAKKTEAKGVAGETFRQKRVPKGTGRVNMNILEVADRTLELQSHVINMLPLVPEVGGVIKNPQWRKAIKQRFGQEHLDTVDKWFKDTLNPYAVYFNRTPIFTALRKNTAPAILFGNLAVSLKQLPSAVFAGQEAGFPAMFRAMEEIGQDYKGMQDWLNKTFPQYKNRRAIYDIDELIVSTRAIDGDTLAARKLKKGWAQFKKAVGKGAAEMIIIPDKLASGAVLRSVYNQGIKDGLSHPEAVKLAEDSFLRNQPQSAIPLAAEIYRSGEAPRLFTQFTSQLNGIYNQIRNDLPREWRQGKKGKQKAFRIIASLLVQSMAIWSVSHGGRKPENAQEWGEAFIESGAASVPIVGPLAVSTYRGFSGKLPVQTGLDAAAQAARSLAKGDPLATIPKALRATGLLTGIPTIGPERLLRGAFDLATGETKDPRRLLISPKLLKRPEEDESKLPFSKRRATKRKVIKRETK